MNTRSFAPSNFSVLSLFLFLFLFVAQISAAPAPARTVDSDSISRYASPTASESAEASATESFIAKSSATETSDEDEPESTGTLSQDDEAPKPVPTVIMPKAFDTSIPSDNFTSYTCYPFFTSFLQNKTFTECFPLSFFLQNSRSWFNILKEGEVAVTQALDASCKVDAQKCQAVMTDLSRQLLSPNNCGQEFKARNPIVTQAYASFLTYSDLFSAGCLKDKKTGDYCYAQAATKSDNPADTYIYFLPLGVTLPGGSRLTCSDCLQQTMMIYASAAGNQSLPLYNTYTPSAQQIGIGCGPTFVNTTASIQSSSTSLWTSSSSTRWLACASALIASVVLLA